MMRKMLLTMAVLAVMVPVSDAAAQYQVNASATIGDHILLTGTGDLSFGTVARGADAVISAVDGTVTRTLVYNRDVDVSFTVPAALTGAGGSLPVTLYCAHQTGATWTGETNPCSSGPILLDVGGSTTTTTLGFGGRILQADIDAAVAGTYSATLDIVVSPRT